MVGVDGLRVLVTAASRGVGYQIARILAERGAHVAICSSTPRIAETAREIMESVGANVEYTICDLRYPTSVHRLFSWAVKKLGGLDAIVYNAPSPSAEPVLVDEAEPGDWLEAASLYLVAPALLSKLLIEHTVARGGRSSITFVSSVTVLEPMSPFIVADVCRAGLTRLAKVIARNYARYGVKANVLLLGSFDTPGARLRVKAIAKRLGLEGEAWEKLVVERSPCRRTGSWEELGDVIVLLVRPDLEFLNGTVIQLDCSMTRCVLI